MNKVVNARYDANENVLRLVERLDGVRHDADVRINVVPAGPDERRPWLALEGSLSAAAGEDLAQSIERLFGDDE